MVTSSSLSREKQKLESRGTGVKRESGTSKPRKRKPKPAPSPAVLPSRATPRQGFFRAEDDTPIYFQVEGEGRPLLFCYGLLCRCQHWVHQVDRFRKTHRIVTFDYRGHQRSGRPRNDRNLTLGWVARDITGLLDHLGMEEIVGLGHSLGVPALVKAMSEERRFRAGVLICGAVTNPFLHMFYTDRIQKLYQATAVAHEHLPEVTDYLWRRFTRVNPVSRFLIRHLGFNPETALDRDVLSYMEGVAETPFAVFQAFLRDYTRFDGRGLLPRVEAPVLVVAGEDDVITPVYLMEEMARLLPKGELVKVAQASHNAHMDFPDEVNDAISAFLERFSYR